MSPFCWTEKIGEPLSLMEEVRICSDYCIINQLNFWEKYTSLKGILCSIMVSKFKGKYKLSNFKICHWWRKNLSWVRQKSVTSMLTRTSIKQARQAFFFFQKIYFCMDFFFLKQKFHFFLWNVLFKTWTKTCGKHQKESFLMLRSAVNSRWTNDVV